jgi:hypothetical protein
MPKTGGIARPGLGRAPGQRSRGDLTTARPHADRAWQTDRINVHVQQDLCASLLGKMADVVPGRSILSSHP